MALAVIDMQYAFSCSGAVIEAVCKEIRKARRNKEPIYNVMYRGGGSVFKKVRKELKKGPFVELYKKDQGGGLELRRALLKAKALKRVNKVRFCGIYADQCVFDTANELAKLEKFLLVEIMCRSVESADGAESGYGFPRTRAKNLKIVK